MGWEEFTAYLGAMNREQEPRETDVGSWAGTDNDEWWVNARREREEMQRRE